jgi:hypothetical protein
MASIRAALTLNHSCCQRKPHAGARGVSGRDLVRRPGATRDADVLDHRLHV